MFDISEDIFFFQGGSGSQLLGFLSKPEKPKAGILFCHPFAEEKNCAHFIVAEAARKFAQLGYAVMRFDLSGCGDSEGEFDEFTIENWLADIQTAKEHLREEAQVEDIYLWGLRFGAGLVLLDVQQSHDASGLILWQPIFDFQLYIHQYLRNQLGSNITSSGNGVSVKSLISNLEADEKVEVFGYTLSPTMYKNFMKVGKIEPSPDVNNQIFIASISQMETPPMTITQVVDKLKLSQKFLTFQHIEEEPFWDRYERWQAPNTTAKTANWLASIN